MKYVILILVAVTFLSCKKSPPIPPNTPEKYENGILVLNEGLFEQNNASISFYDGSESFQQVFKSENARGLGDTANDFEAYSMSWGDFILIVTDVSSQIEVIDRYSLKTVAQIPMFDGINARQPRRVVIQNFRGYVCNFDGTVAVIDLITNNLVTIIDVGANPDGMVFSNNKLFVSNSGGLNFPIYDSTVSVIDPMTNTVIETIDTRINSSQMVVDAADDIYLISRGNYSDVPTALLRINAVDNVVEETIEMPISSMNLYNDWLYYYDSEEKGIYRYNTLTEIKDPSQVLDASGFETFYGFEIDEEKQQLFCIDANSYVNSSTIRVYSMVGVLQYEFQAGLNANNFIFNN